jgi:hypothetical protein
MPSGAAPGEEARARLQRIVRMYDPSSGGSATDAAAGTGGAASAAAVLAARAAISERATNAALDEAALRKVLSDMGLRPDEDERDAHAVETTLRGLRAAGKIPLSGSDFVNLMDQQAFLRGEAGRHWVHGGRSDLGRRPVSPRDSADPTPPS